MEEAYTALYQEFLHLQSICLKQAAMLQHLSDIVQKQQGGNDVSQIDGKLDKLHLNLDLPEQKQDGHDRAVVQNPVRTVNNSPWEDLRKAEQHYNATQTSRRRPWSSSFLDSEMVSQAGGLFMSEVTLQSQVCEFCHAVFPGHTSTRGEFLRHLTTHMT
ncbi:uncharacterized protein [Misgurnus anguillicaudatus]|uniref:uncharacterized protein n=1 Tax=Misgurnus anguillicaudatus TaxID=75329 RepID=UPI002435A885|nr:uncharacterized protein zgc:113184 [Misgurnus anguillicaudatus]